MATTTLLQFSEVDTETFTPTTTKPSATMKTTVKPVSEKEEVNHYNDWPNTPGFETLDEQRTPIELTVIGNIPAYAAGTLYRTGPGTYKVEANNGKTVKRSHWFDGFTQVHRFHIVPSTDIEKPTKVFYNSRREVDALMEHIRKTGKIDTFTFGQKRDPCQSFFKKVMSSFSSSVLERQAVRKPDGQNIGVSLSVNMPSLPTGPAPKRESTAPIKTLVNKTDAAYYQYIDPETLEPAGLADQTVLHPDLKGPLSATHAKTDPLTGDVYNYNLEVGRKPTYRIWHASTSTQKTTILATITTAPAAYLHSLFLTTNHVILCIWGSHFAYSGLSMLYHRNVLDAIAPLDPSSPCIWLVVDRTPARRGVVATYHTPAFYAFHSINAFEEPSRTHPGKTDILADLACYDDSSVLKRFYYSNLLSSSPGALAYTAPRGDSTRSWLGRFRLPAIPGPADAIDAKPQQAERVFAADKAQSLELPTLNPEYITRPYRYIYGVTDRGSSTFFDGLAKFDIETCSSLHWSEKGQTAGEPIFVRDPEGGGEDEGVLLSVVLDGFRERSYLLCLDARTMREVGRADLGAVVGFGFHGIHVPVEGKGGSSGDF